jgi:hypothetical protein
MAKCYHSQTCLALLSLLVLPTVVPQGVCCTVAHHSRVLMFWWQMKRHGSCHCHACVGWQSGELSTSDRGAGASVYVRSSRFDCSDSRVRHSRLDAVR